MARRVAGWDPLPGFHTQNPLRKLDPLTLLRILPKESGPLVWGTVQTEGDIQRVKDQSCSDIDVLRHWCGYLSVES